MTPEQIDRVFGRGRLQMVTGAHVEVFREAARPGESRRYTKRFLTTDEGDYAHWTEREWRILARLIGHGARCIPDVVQYDRDARGTKLVQTYDAGATVDQWATLLPVERDGRMHAHVFEDCAHWWALAHHCLVALDEIHSLHLVHLDVKGDNICVPIGPPTFDPAAPGRRLYPMFRKLALIDFAFSLVSGETLTTPLPIGWQQDYDYQSPRLLRALESGRAGDLDPTERLDWRCDMYSLAAMLKRYLPGEERLFDPARACGWTVERYEAARALILRIREAHDTEIGARRPHADLIAETGAQVRVDDLARSLERGWTLARDAQPVAVPALPLTPVTRLAPSIRVVVPPGERIVVTRVTGTRPVPVWPRERNQLTSKLAAATGIVALVAIAAVLGRPDLSMQYARSLGDNAWAFVAAMRDALRGRASGVVVASAPRVAGATTDASAARHATPTDEAGASPEATPMDEPAPMPDVPRADPGSEPASAAEEGPPPAATTGAETAPAAKPSASSSDSFAARLEAFRSLPSPRAPRAVQNARSNPSSAATQRSSRLTAAKKPMRSPPIAAPAARTSPTLAAKRSKTQAAIASVQPAVRSATKATSSVAVAPPTAPVEQPKAIEAASSTNTADVRLAALPPSVPAPVAAPQPSAPPVAAPPVTGAQVAVPPVAVPQIAVAPVAAPHGSAAPVEQPRSFPAPPPAGATGVAPIVEASRALVTPAIQPPRDNASREAPARVPLRPPIDPQRDAPEDSDGDDQYLAQARRVLASVVPRTASQAHAQISRVLWIAAGAHHPAQERAVVAAASQPGIAAEGASMPRDIAPIDARRLHDEARQAFIARRHVPEALELAMKAFGANPYDADIAGYLAFLHLKVLPAQPERARQLALHAIGMRGAHQPTGRADDWTTFAIASALTGRATDARHALYASLALTRNTDRSCRVALAALATYGERMREPVEAMLQRLHAQGRGDDSPYCVLPPSRVAGMR